ncbi:MAG: hypothetical protein HY897_23060 [Deltaproteobacteria bacterium]|nr:hypothetical protein [Deltaproteobacteria bacterium]
MKPRSGAGSGSAGPAGAPARRGRGRGGWTNVHGVFLDVSSVGILITGKSGIGKSECALDLVCRGHKLVADDAVKVRRTGRKAIEGEGSGLVRHHMEIQGLGIVDIRELFGVAAVRDRKRIDLLIELVEWAAGAEYDRLGIDEKTRTLLGVEVPALTLPVRPGRSIATIVEVAARNQLLKAHGVFTAREFQQRLAGEIARGTSPRVGRRAGADPAGPERNPG